MRTEDFNILETIGSKSRADRGFAHAVEWRENDFEISRTGESLAGNGLGESAVYLLLAEDDLAIFDRGLEVRLLDLRRAHHPLDNRLIVRRDNLRAARPVDLHGIVARRIVAGGDHDA